MDYKIDVNGVVSTYHANMLKQYVERRNELSHCLLSTEAIESVDDDNENFPLDDRTFPTAKKPESYRDVSISDTLTSEQRKEVETLMKQYPDVLSSLLTEYSMILSCLRQNLYEQKDIPFRIRRVASWRLRFKTCWI